MNDVLVGRGKGLSRGVVGFNSQSPYPELFCQYQLQRKDVSLIVLPLPIQFASEIYLSNQAQEVHR